jgi:hypothetical protein
MLFPPFYCSSRPHYIPIIRHVKAFRCLDYFPILWVYFLAFVRIIFILCRCGFCKGEKSPFPRVFPPANRHHALFAFLHLDWLKSKWYIVPVKIHLHRRGSAGRALCASGGES